MKIEFCKKCGCMLDVDESTGLTYCSACGYKEEPESEGEAPVAVSEPMDEELGSSNHADENNPEEAEKDEREDAIVAMANAILAISKGESPAEEKPSAEIDPPKETKKAPDEKPDKPKKEKPKKPKAPKKKKEKKAKIKKDPKTDYTLFILIFASICNLLFTFIGVFPSASSISIFFTVQILISSAHIMMGLCGVDFYLLKKNGTLYGALHLVCAALSTITSLLIAMTKDAGDELVPVGILCSIGCLLVGWLCKKGEQLSPYVTAAVLLPICIVFEFIVSTYAGAFNRFFNIITTLQVLMGHALFATIAFNHKEFDWGAVHVIEAVATIIISILLL